MTYDELVDYCKEASQTISELDYKNRILEKENQELKRQLEVGEEQYNDLVEEKEELQEQLSSNTLQLEKLKEQVNKGLYNTCLPYTTGYNKAIKDKETQQKEFINYLEDEKDRLIKETSHYYIDSFDRQHAVNETIYDEVDVILQKYKSIIGVSDENKRN